MKMNETTIKRIEYKRAVKHLKNDKTSGVNRILCEIIKQIGKTKYQILSGCGKVPEVFKNNLIMSIPKKEKSHKCHDILYTTISLISLTAKILSKIVERRIETTFQTISWG